MRPSININILLHAANEDCSEQSNCLDLMRKASDHSKQHFLRS